MKCAENDGSGAKNCNVSYPETCVKLTTAGRLKTASRPINIEAQEIMRKCEVSTTSKVVGARRRNVDSTKMKTGVK